MKCKYFHAETLNEYERCLCRGDIPSPWRDVREELPEVGDSVLTCNIMGICADEREPVTGFIDMEDGKWYRPWTNEELTPTHWMPLPNPLEIKE